MKQITESNQLDKDHEMKMKSFGQAPYHCVGTHEAPFKTEVCDYCSTVITIVFDCVSSDGHHFVLGSTCIDHLNDRKLKYEVAEKLRERREAKAQIKIDVAKKVYSDVSEKLKIQKHPNYYYANQGKTLLDYVDYLFKFGGTKGQLNASKIVMEASI